MFGKYILNGAEVVDVLGELLTHGIVLGNDGHGKCLFVSSDGATVVGLVLVKVTQLNDEERCVIVIAVAGNGLVVSKDSIFGLRSKYNIFFPGKLFFRYI